MTGKRLCGIIPKITHNGLQNTQKKKVTHFFDESSAWQGCIYLNKQDYFARLVNRIKEYSFSILDEVLDETVETVFDAGCGSGVYLEEFLEMGYNVIGMDLSKVMVNRIQESLKEKEYEGGNCFREM